MPLFFWIDHSLGARAEICQKFFVGKKKCSEIIGPLLLLPKLRLVIVSTILQQSANYFFWNYSMYQYAALFARKKFVKRPIVMGTKKERTTALLTNALFG